MSHGTGLFVFSNIYDLDYYVQNTGILAGRNLLIDILRESFARDREYPYVRDIFGFPKTPNQSGLSPTAGQTDSTATRIFIGSAYRYDISFLPAIIVRNTSTTYNPISFTQNKWVLEFEKQTIVDGYGNSDLISVPSAYTFAGAWDQTFEIKVMSRSLEDTVSLADLVLITLQATYREALQQNGLFVKSCSAGGENAESINANDPFFTISITVNTRSEWRREIPIANLVDRVQFCFTFDMVDTDVPATGLAIKDSVS